MKIRVTLVGSLCRFFDGQKTREMDLPDGATAADILHQAGLPEEFCSFIMINGTKVAKNYKLTDQDEVVIFPLVSGG